MTHSAYRDEDEVEGRLNEVAGGNQVDDRCMHDKTYTFDITGQSLLPRITRAPPFKWRTYFLPAFRRLLHGNLKPNLFQSRPALEDTVVAL